MLGGLLLVSCGQMSLSPKEIISVVESKDNGFIRVKELKEVSFWSAYKPPEYMAVKDLGSEDVEMDSLAKAIRSYEHWMTFTFRVKSNDRLHPLEKGNATEKDYFHKLSYYINAQQDFKLLVDGKDTLECALYHMERNYGAAPFIDINLGFVRPKKKVEEYITLLYQDRVFSNGLIKFKYDENKVNQLPNFVLR